MTGPTPTPDASLWSNTERSRFFIIPDEATLPPGELTLRTLTGRRQDVDPLSAATFEVTEAEAKEWVKEEFGHLLDSARGAIDRFIEKLRKGPAA